MMNVIIKKVQMLIAEGKILEALEMLLTTVDRNSDKRQQLLKLRNRLQKLEIENSNNLLPSEFVNLERSNISKSLLDMTYRLNNEDFEKDINVTIVLKGSKTAISPTKSERFSFWHWFKNLFSPSY
jgi:hypothetical protein